MDLQIRGRVALVTGASSGLGRACALALAAEGVRLVVAARRLDELERVAAEARSAGAMDALALAVDLSEPTAIEVLIAKTEAAYGPVEILLVNGGGPKAGTYTTMRSADWDTAYNTTLKSALRLIEGVLPGMRKRGWGRIVALESTSVKQPIANLVLSNTFRTAVVAALKSLATEVANDGITVNVIATGRVDTPRLRSLFNTDEAWKRAAEEIPMRRIATPQEFAPLVAFLCSQLAGYITGTTIQVDGGMTSSLF